MLLKHGRFTAQHRSCHNSTRHADFLVANMRLQVSPELADLLRKMLKVDPRNRITIGDVARHPWVTSSLPRQLVFLNEMLEAARKRAQRAAEAEAAAIDAAAADMAAAFGPRCSGCQSVGNSACKPSSSGGSSGCSSGAGCSSATSAMSIGSGCRLAHNRAVSCGGRGGGGSSGDPCEAGRLPASAFSGGGGRPLSRGSSASSTGQLPLATAAASAVAAARPLSRSGSDSSSGNPGRRQHTSVALTFFIRQSDKDLRALVREAATGGSAAAAGVGCSSRGGHPKP